MTRKPPSKPRSDTRAAVRHLARAIRGLTHEISVLRRYVLELRAQHAPREYEVPPKPAPCTHPTSRGWGSIGSDGSSDGEIWCDKCGKQLTFRKEKSAVKPAYSGLGSPNDWPRL